MRKFSLRYSALLCASAVIFSFCGCAVGKPISLSEDIHLQQLREARPQGLGYSVAVAPVLVYRVRGTDGKDSWPLTVKAGSLQKEIAATLKEVPVFTSVMQAPSPDAQAARERGAQLLLKVSLSNCTASFGGTNGYFIPNMLIWGILSPIASAFVADEFYSVEGKVSAQLVDTSSGEPVWTRSITLKERYNLNDWQRGPTVWDFFFIAPFYTSWTPQKVDSVVLPHVIHKINVELAKNILADLPPPGRSFAIVAGVNRCGASGAPELKYAEKDADDFAALLSETGFSDITLLKGEEATRPAIESALRSLAARKDVTVQNLVVYFAGLGTTRLSRETSACVQSLLTYGSGGKATQISLPELLTLIEPIATQNKTVVIDAGFSGKTGRTATLEEIPAGTAYQFPDAVLNAADTSLLLSCEAGGTAREFDDLQNGAFTHFLLRGLAGKADLNNDSIITVEEALKTTAWPVTRYVSTQDPGQTQKPCALGRDPAAALLELK